MKPKQASVKVFQLPKIENKPSLSINSKKFQTDKNKNALENSSERKNKEIVDKEASSKQQVLRPPKKHLSVKVRGVSELHKAVLVMKIPLTDNKSKVSSRAASSNRRPKMEISGDSIIKLRTKTSREPKGNKIASLNPPPLIKFKSTSNGKEKIESERKRNSRKLEKAVSHDLKNENLVKVQQVEIIETAKEKPIITKDSLMKNLEINMKELELNKEKTETRRVPGMLGTRTLNRDQSQMEIKIKELLKGGKLNSTLCEAYGLKPFQEENYIFLEILGKGTFGEVFKAKEKQNKWIVAIKRVKLSQIENNPKLSSEEKEDKLASNIASFLLENSMFLRLAATKNYPECLPKYYGAYYELEANGDIKNLVLVTEGGDFNLEELVNARKNDIDKPNKTPYTPEEVLRFLAYILEGYQLLLQLRIYHSDTKLQNIVYSKAKNCYMIIDFGASKLLPDNTEKSEFPVSEYCDSGTELFNSPEKQKFWSFSLEHIDDDEEYSTENTFDPHKCDMWALGVCVMKMLNGNSESSLVSEVIGGLLKEDWRLRFNALELSAFLKKNNVTKPKIFYETEKKFIGILENQRFEKEQFKLLYEKYKEAKEPTEMLNIAQREYDKFVKGQLDNFTLYKREICERLAEALNFNGRAQDAEEHLIEARKHIAGNDEVYEESKMKKKMKSKASKKK